MTPLISIVIPSYNHRSFIGEAIASAASQTYQPTEIVVIDDGSTDGSFEYIQERHGKAIAHLSRRANRGAHATLNEAIALAQGEWVAVLNSDDVYDPSRIAKLAEYAAREGYDLVFSNVDFVDERGPLATSHKAVQSHARAVAGAERDSIEQALLRGNFTLTSSNLMIRKATFEAIGPFQPYRYCHDWDLLLRAAGRVRIGWLREPLLRYRLHSANTIREPDPWLYLTEKGLVYASFLCDSSAREPRGMQHSRYILESREFSPFVVAWLISESRRLGLRAILHELEAGRLHQRLRAEFEPHLDIRAAGLTARDAGKHVAGLRASLERIRTRLGGG